MHDTELKTNNTSYGQSLIVTNRDITVKAIISALSVGHCSSSCNTH